LVSKYEFGNHPRKTAILPLLLQPEAVAFIRRRTARRVTQCPDLLMFAPDFSDWFFCEVKGPGDRVRPDQRCYFRRLASLTARPVYMIRFKQV